MTITPQFSLKQNDTSIIISIHVPHIRISIPSLTSNNNYDENNGVIHIVLTDHDHIFHFACIPYLLILNFKPNQFEPYNEEDIDNDIDINTNNNGTSNDINNNEQINNQNNHNHHERVIQYDPTLNHGTIIITLKKKYPLGHWDQLDCIGRWKQLSTKQQQQ